MEIYDLKITPGSPKGIHAVIRCHVGETNGPDMDVTIHACLA